MKLIATRYRYSVHCVEVRLPCDFDALPLLSLLEDDSVKFAMVSVDDYTVTDHYRMIVVDLNDEYAADYICYRWNNILNELE